MIAEAFSRSPTVCAGAAATWVATAAHRSARTGERVSATTATETTEAMAAGETVTTTEPTMTAGKPMTTPAEAAMTTCREAVTRTAALRPAAMAMRSETAVMLRAEREPMLRRRTGMMCRSLASRSGAALTSHGSRFRGSRLGRPRLRFRLRFQSLELRLQASQLSLESLYFVPGRALAERRPSSHAHDRPEDDAGEKLSHIAPFA
jgi:hypothetical protein